MLVLAPVMCILSGIGVSQVLSTYMKNLDITRPDKKTKKQQDSTYPIKNEVSGGISKHNCLTYQGFPPHIKNATYNIGCRMFYFTSGGKRYHWNCL